MPGPMWTRRQFLATVGLAAVGVACSHPQKARPQSLSVFGSADQENPINPGKNRYAFGLVTSTGGVLSGGAPQLYLTKTGSTERLGPFDASWFPFTAYEKTGDHSPKTEIPGTYVAEIDVPSAGAWVVRAVATSAGSRQEGLARLTVQTSPVIAAVGSKAISTKSPVATTEEGRKEICTRVPPDKMHAISLDQALTNGKPTVVSFATPLLCESRLCGPVVDEQILVFEHIGADRANFIHVEEFLPGKDLTPPPATLETRSPAFKVWGFTTEPWVIVIDSTGIIRGRLGPGATTATEIEATLTPML